MTGNVWLNLQLTRTTDPVTMIQWTVIVSCTLTTFSQATVIPFLLSSKPIVAPRSVVCRFGISTIILSSFKVIFWEVGLCNTQHLRHHNYKLIKHNRLHVQNGMLRIHCLLLKKECCKNIMLLDDRVKELGKIDCMPVQKNPDKTQTRTLDR